MSQESSQLERSLERGIFPLVATKDERIYPIGTAFCISKIGLLLTAAHNLHDALRYHDRGDALRAMDRLPSGLDVRGLGFGVIWRQIEESSGRMTLWPIEYMAGGPPTDVLFAYPQFQSEFPYQSFHLSFAVPRIGSVVRCVGYSEMEPEGLGFDEFRTNPQQYKHRFHCIPGAVKAILLDGFSRGFIDGPCAIVECDVPHGVSGGPVFNEAGDVFGVVSAGATTLVGHGLTLVSLIYPLLFTPIKIGARMGPLTLTGEHPLLSYIASGSIITDGSEEGLNIHKIDGRVAVGPRIQREDARNVFANYAAFLDGKPVEPFVGENWHVRRNTP
jgi:hypothetical protein